MEGKGTLAVLSPVLQLVREGKGLAFSGLLELSSLPQEQAEPPDGREAASAQGPTGTSCQFPGCYGGVLRLCPAGGLPLQSLQSLPNV